MPSITSAFYYLLHPKELRAIIQWNVWHTPVYTRDEEKEEPSLRRCFDFLDLTSRSFAAVIKELNHELLVPICLFYLPLRGLDTIEDDMTIPLEKKEPLLRNFYTKLDEDGWYFEGNASRVKDRELLVQFYHVITEFKKIKEPYQVVIRDITKRMGNGMADYQKETDIQTVMDYEKYCHYVAGLVGEGLTRIFVESGMANPALLKRPDLYESMGQFLQQTNIIRDVREDFDEERRFWPKQIWSKYVKEWEDLFKPENRDTALRCSSEMVLNALERADDCLYYLAGIREQSVFNFTAIPQSMAVATLELCFRNPALFERNVKITKGQACALMTRSSQNLEILYGVFKEYARKIHKKNDPRDPNFLKVSVACGKIEQFIETIFPTQTPRTLPRATSAEATGAGSTNANTVTPSTAGEDQTEKKRQEEEQRKREDAEAKKDVMYMGLAVLSVVLVISIFMIFVAWLAGARFDLAFQQIMKGNFRAKNLDEVKESVRASAGVPTHGEL